MPNTLHTAAENGANAAPVPAFSFIVNDYWRARRVREKNTKFWMHTLFEAELAGDLKTIRQATDRLAEFVMQARADGEAKFGEAV